MILGDRLATVWKAIQVQPIRVKLAYDMNLPLAYCVHVESTRDADLQTWSNGPNMLCTCSWLAESLCQALLHVIHSCQLVHLTFLVVLS